MKASDIITELRKRIDLYGDCEVIFRDSDGDDDIDVLSVYHDEDTERTVISNQFDHFAE
jgi:hypothetical protein